MALLLLCVLTMLFFKGLLPGMSVASNDGPLGLCKAAWERPPAWMFGLWDDLNWVGYSYPSGIPSITAIWSTMVGPLLTSKFYAFTSLFLLGLSAWVFFRECKFSAGVCLVGGLAAALNSDFLSTACWGVAAQPIGFGMMFLGLAALADQSSPKQWVRMVLAGSAVGMGINESYDIGAIFSVFVGAFIIFEAFNGQAGAVGQRLAAGLARLTLVAVFAAVLAAGALSSLVSTQVKGIVGMAQDPATKAMRWKEATQWSLPKWETLGVLVPGVFGFRMETPKDVAAFGDWFQGGQYWGAVGQDPAYDEYLAARKAGQDVPRPGGYPRFTGGGSYTGVLVIVIALFGAAQSLRRMNGAFSPAERRVIHFWLGAAVVAIVMAYGRHAPFYRFFYALPYTSTIRNPAKFIHVFCWILVILFGYGLEGLRRQYLQGQAGAGAAGLGPQMRAWWSKATAFEKNWIKGSWAALGASLLGWLVYACARERLVAYLQEVNFNAATADVLAGFSLRQVGWFILLLVPALGLMAVVLSGYFSGRRARVGMVLIGVLIAADLMAADLPWVIVYNWKVTYASNPILDLMREKPYEHRVSVLPVEQFFDIRKFPPAAAPLVENYFTMRDLYNSEWKQHLFPYYNVQSLDVVQLPRVPIQYSAFETALRPLPLRHWELTNTRYLLGLALPPDQLNQALDPIRKPFRILKYFKVAPKPDQTGPIEGFEQLTAVPTTDGPLALYEYTAALPRARLYANWQVSTNDEQTLKLLANRGFDPAQTVLVADTLPAPAPAQTNASPSQSAGTVEFASYAPRQIVLHAKAAAPSVLLLNDQFDPGWKVSVDGKPAALLRCNYVMRGVQVPAGEHQIEFRFTAPLTGLYTSLVGLAVGVVLLLCLGVPRKPESHESSPQSRVHSPQPRAGR